MRSRAERESGIHSDVDVREVTYQLRPARRVMGGGEGFDRRIRSRHDNGRNLGCRPAPIVVNEAGGASSLVDRSEDRLSFLFNNRRIARAIEALI